MHIFWFQSNGRYRQVLSKKCSWKEECGKIRHFGGEQTYSFLCWHMPAANNILLNLRCLNRFSICAWFSFNHCSVLLCIKSIFVAQPADIFGGGGIIVTDVVPNNYTCFWEAIAWLRPWQWLIFLHVFDVLSISMFVMQDDVHLYFDNSWYIFGIHITLL